MDSRKISRFFVYFFLTVGALIMLLPFFWMFSSAFKTTQEINRFPPQWLPSHLSLDNFKRAFEMAPFEMLIITNYTTVVNLKIYDTLYALILPFTSSIFYTYILKNFFDSISDSLYWSARIDGSSNWRFLWKVMVPMARPSLMTIILLNGLASWNSFMWPMYVIVSKENRTLPWGLQVFTTEAGSYPELLMAASSVVVFPVVILFLFARKYIVRGVARGGLKG